MKAMKNNKYAALEMPTGTGKTLSLLCSTLAYIEEMRKKTGNKDIKLVYTSRTHSQLSQVRKEIKKSPYGYFISTTIGSRD